MSIVELMMMLLEWHPAFVRTTPSPVVLVCCRWSELVEVDSKRQLVESEVLDNIVLYSCKKIT